MNQQTKIFITVFTIVSFISFGAFYKKSKLPLRNPSSEKTNCSEPIFRAQNPFFVTELWNEKSVNVPGKAGEEFQHMNTQVELYSDFDTSVGKNLYPGSFVTSETIRDDGDRKLVLIRNHSNTTNARKKFLKYLQASRATESEYLEKHDLILESYENTSGLTHINNCPDKTHCDPLKLLDPKEMVFEVTEDHYYEDSFSGQRIDLRKGDRLELVKDRNNDPLQRNCPSQLSSSSLNEKSFFFRKMQESYDFRSFVNLEEARDLAADGKFIEFSHDSLHDMKLSALPKDKYKILNSLSRQLSDWELAYEVKGEFSGVRPLKNKSFFPFELFYLEDMDLVQIPTDPVDIDGFFYGKAPFGSYHYMMGLFLTKVEDNDIESPSNELVRELERDSFLEPYAACSFLGFLENYQRACFFKKLNLEKEKADITMDRSFSKLNPLGCHESGEEKCDCSPIQWGDMYSPKGTHQTHYKKKCVDIRAFRIDKDLGPTRMSRADEKANLNLIKLLCRSGASTIYYNFNTQAINQELKKEGLGCRVQTVQGHDFHIHTCFAETLTDEEKTSLENYCKHPKAMDEMRRISIQFQQEGGFY